MRKYFPLMCYVNLCGICNVEVDIYHHCPGKYGNSAREASRI